MISIKEIEKPKVNQIKIKENQKLSISKIYIGLPLFHTKSRGFVGVPIGYRRPNAVSLEKTHCYGFKKVLSFIIIFLNTFFLSCNNCFLAALVCFGYRCTDAFILRKCTSSVLWNFFTFYIIFFIFIFPWCDIVFLRSWCVLLVDTLVWYLYQNSPLWF